MRIVRWSLRIMTTLGAWRCIVSGIAHTGFSKCFYLMMIANMWVSTWPAETIIPSLEEILIKEFRVRIA